MHKYRVISQILSTAFIFTSPLPNTHDWFIATVLFGVPTGAAAGSLELQNFSARTMSDAFAAAEHWVRTTYDSSAQFTQER